MSITVNDRITAQIFNSYFEGVGNPKNNPATKFYKNQVAEDKESAAQAQEDDPDAPDWYPPPGLA